MVYSITGVIHGTIPSYRVNYSPKRYNKIFLLPNKLSLQENNQVMKELNLIQKTNKYYMELTEMKLYKNMLNIVVIVDILCYHTNMNGVVFHADSTHLLKYSEKK